MSLPLTHTHTQVLQGKGKVFFITQNRTLTNYYSWPKSCCRPFSCSPWANNFYRAKEEIEYVTEAICGPQRLKDLECSSSLEKSTGPSSRIMPEFWNHRFANTTKVTWDSGMKLLLTLYTNIMLGKGHSYMSIIHQIFIKYRI